MGLSGIFRTTTYFEEEHWLTVFSFIYFVAAKEVGIYWKFTSDLLVEYNLLNLLLVGHLMCSHVMNGTTHDSYLYLTVYALAARDIIYSMAICELA